MKWDVLDLRECFDGIVFSESDPALPYFRLERNLFRWFLEVYVDTQHLWHLMDSTPVSKSNIPSPRFALHYLIVSILLTPQVIRLGESLVQLKKHL